jgi:hypothetical protein
LLFPSFFRSLTLVFLLLLHMKKTLSLLVLITALVAVPLHVFAAVEDLDKDRYYSCDADPCTDTLPVGGKGFEKTECDQIEITDPSIVAPDVTAEGRRVHPGAIEPPNSEIDFNCDGKISGYVPEENSDDRDLFGIIGDIITLIGQIAVFVSTGAVIYGGIMFATASGEEAKIQKAKKTIMGAVVGLIVGILAWNIVDFVTGWIG